MVTQGAGPTYFNTDGQVVLLDGLIVQWVIDLDVGPGESVFGSLLQIKGVKLVCLGGGAGHQPVEDSGVIFYAGANRETILKRTSSKATRLLSVSLSF